MGETEKLILILIIFILSIIITIIGGIFLGLKEIFITNKKIKLIINTIAVGTIITSIGGVISFSMLLVLIVFITTI